MNLEMKTQMMSCYEGLLNELESDKKKNRNNPRLYHVVELMMVWEESYYYLLRLIEMVLIE